MKLGGATAFLACCHVLTAASGFITCDVSNSRAVGAPTGRGRAMDATGERLAESRLIELRGGKTVGAKKSGSEASSSKGKASKKSKKSSKGKKPSFMATVRAFFASLVNPHFVLKLQAKQKNQIHTVHGSGSSTGADDAA